MRRRNFLRGAIPLGFFALAPRVAHAYTQCIPDNSGMEICESGINLSRIAEASSAQYLNQWCWAASIQMAFAHYGYKISQDRIVSETYGVVANIPAITGYAISKNLQRDWEDDSGDSFFVEIEGLYDFDAGITGITDIDIINALDDERPLIMGTQSHAVLLVSIAYYKTPTGPMIGNIGVADPWPGIGIRGPYSPLDFRPMHLGGNLRYLCLPRIS